MSLLAALFPVSLLLGVLLSALIQRSLERGRWNCGWCARCDRSWRRFDIDSGGECSARIERKP